MTLKSLFASVLTLAALQIAAKSPLPVADGILTIPKSVRQIPDFEFFERHDIREVRFEENSQCLSIGSFAFACCDSLHTVTLPPRLARLGEGCFRECSSLDSIEIPAGILEIPKEAFIRCLSLRQISLPQRLLEIKGFAFADCHNLQQISFSPRLKEIGNNAFARCLSLDSVYIPDSVSLLESYAFAGCSALRRIRLPAVHNTLGEQILEDCPALDSIEEMSKSAPSFECDSFLADPVADPDFYRRVTLIYPTDRIRDYSRSHCWKLFFQPPSIPNPQSPILP